MPQETLYTQILDLDSLDVYLETPTNDESYFSVRGLPEQLGYGKHFFTLTYKDPANQPLLATNSSIVFEFVDSNGTVVFSELADIEDVSGAATGYIWIKEDPLRTADKIFDGELTMYIVGTLDGVPVEWQGQRNLRSSFTFDIRKNIPNLSPIMLYDPDGAITSASFTETLEEDSKPGYNRGYINISASHLQTQGGKIKFAELSYRETGSQSTDFTLLNTFDVDNDDAIYEVPKSGSQGLNPISTKFKTPIPKEIRRDTPVIFKLRYLDENKTPAQYYDENRLNEQIIITSSVIDVDGSPIIIESRDNLLRGSMYTGQAVGKGFEQSGRSSAYLKTVDYTGFKSASLGIGSPGVMFFSGSVLTSSGDDYEGVGLELFGTTESYFRYRSNPSELDIRTNAFFVGTERSQFISASNGQIEISSSKFHLSTSGDVKIVGNIDADGGTIGGFEIQEDQINSFNQNLILKASGQVSASSLLLASGSFTIDPDNLSRFGEDGFGSFVMANDTGVRIQTSNFNLNTARFIISSSDVGVIAMGSTPPTTFGAGKGVFLDGDGNALIGDADGERIQFNGFNLVMSSSAFFLGSEENFLSGSQGNITLSGSRVRVLTPTFLFGDPNTAFISGSNGLMEISSSNFSIDGAGNAKFLGRIEALEGFIGGFGITKDAITGSNIIISGSPAIGGDHDPTYMFISSSNWNLKENGDMTGSRVHLDGGAIGGFELSATQLNSVNDNLILKDSGQITASNAQIQGKITAESGTIGGFNIGDDLDSAAGTLKLKGATGQITASDAQLTGKVTATSGQIAGWKIIGNVLSGSNATLDAEGAALFMSNKGPGTDNDAAFDILRNEYYIDFTPADQNATSSYFVKFGPNFAVDDSGTLHASGAVFEGTISASKGIVGGFTTDNSTFTDFNNSIFISGSPATGGDHDSRFMFISSSNFNVKQSGDITGSQVLFTGGKIAGYEIDGTKLKQGSSFHLDGASDAEYFISSSDFQVTPTGEVTGSSALFNGNIDVTGTGTIAAFTLDSSEIKSTNDNLRLKSSGQITASEAQITGKITAQSGTIGGFNIATDLDSSAGTLKLKGATGQITASDAQITGKITAQTGTIGGFNIATDLDSSAGTLKLKGATGQITASDAQISGKITATTGEVGGFTIDADEIKSGTNIGMDSNNKKFTINDTTFGNTGIQLDYNSGTPRAFIGKSDGGFIKFDGSDLEMSGSTFFLGSDSQFISGALGNIEISSSNFHLDNAGNVNMAGTIRASAGFIGGFTINSSTITATNFTLDPANKFISLGSGDEIFIADADTGIQLGDATFGDAPFSVTKAGVLKATSGTIGGWNLASNRLFSDNVNITSAGTIETSDFTSGVKGWRISALNNGTAEFENAVIRGTMKTAVFEKETVNAVGGQLYVANSTVLSGSGTISASFTTMSVENVSGFTGSYGDGAGEILSLKKIHTTGFSTEYIKVQSASRKDPSSDTDFSGDLFVIRGYSGSLSAGVNSSSLGDDPNPPQDYEPGQVLVSTGISGSGFIRLNANPTTNETPYIDIVERTGSVIYDVELKARLGDLSGLSSAQVGLRPGFGLFTERAFLTKDVTVGTLATEHIVIDGTSLKFLDNETTMAELRGTTWTLGGAHGATDDAIVMSPNNGVKLFDDSNNFVIVDSTGLTVTQSGAGVAKFSSTSTIGNTSTEHVELTSTSLKLKDGTTTRLSMDSSGMQIGASATGITLDSSGNATFNGTITIGGSLAAQLSGSVDSASAAQTAAITHAGNLAAGAEASASLAETNSSTLAGNLAAGAEASASLAESNAQTLTQNLAAGSRASASAAQSAIDTMETQVVLSSAGMDLRNDSNTNLVSFGTTTKFFDGNDDNEGNMKLRLNTDGVHAFGNTTESFARFYNEGVQIVSGSTEYAKFAGTTTIGNTSTEHVELTATSLKLKDGSTVRLSMDSSGMQIGAAASGITLNSSGDATFNGTITIGGSLAAALSGSADSASAAQTTANTANTAAGNASTLASNLAAGAESSASAAQTAAQTHAGNLAAGSEASASAAQTAAITHAGNLADGAESSASAAQTAAITHAGNLAAGSEASASAAQTAAELLASNLAAGSRDSASAASSAASTAQSAIDTMETQVVLSSAGMDLRNDSNINVVSYGTTTKFFDGVGHADANRKLQLNADGVFVFGTNTNTFAHLGSHGLKIASGSLDVALFSDVTRIGALNAGHITASSDGLTIMDSATSVGRFGVGGAIIGNTNSNSFISMSTTDISIITGSNKAVMKSTGLEITQSNVGYAQFAGTTTIGNTATEHVEITSTSFKLKDGGTARLTMDSSGLSIGNQFAVDSSGNASFGGTLTIGNIVSSSAQLAGDFDAAGSAADAQSAAQTLASNLAAGAESSASAAETSAVTHAGNLAAGSEASASAAETSAVTHAGNLAAGSEASASAAQTAAQTLASNLAAGAESSASLAESNSQTLTQNLAAGSRASASAAQSAIDTMETQVVLTSAGMSLRASNNGSDDALNGQDVVQFGTTTKFFDGVDDLEGNMKLRLNTDGVHAFANTTESFARFYSEGVQIVSGGVERAKFAATTTIGNTSTEHVEITDTSLKLRDGTTDRITMNSSGVQIGAVATGITLDSSGNAKFSGELVIGGTLAAALSGSADSASAAQTTATLAENLVEGAADSASAANTAAGNASTLAGNLAAGAEASASAAQTAAQNHAGNLAAGAESSASAAQTAAQNHAGNLAAGAEASASAAETAAVTHASNLAAGSSASASAAQTAIDTMETQVVLTTSGMSLRASNDGSDAALNGQDVVQFGTTTKFFDGVDDDDANRKLQLNADGVFVFGANTNTFAHLDNKGLQVVSGSIDFAQFGPVSRIGRVDQEHISMSSAGVHVKDGTTQLALFGATTAIGDVANEHISMSSAGVHVKDGTTQRALFAATTAIGDVANEHITMSSDGVIVKDGATELANFASTTTIGDTSGEHISLSSTAFEIKTDATTTVLSASSTGLDMTGNIKATTIFAGDETQFISSSNGNIEISSSGYHLKSDGTAKFAGGAIELQQSGDIVSNDFLIERSRLFGAGGDGDFTLGAGSSQSDKTSDDNGSVCFSNPANNIWRMEQDVYAENLTIENNVTLNPNGFRLFVKNTLDNSHQIYANGANGTAGGNGSQRSDSTAAAGSGGAGTPSGTLLGSPSGSNGGTGGTGDNSPARSGGGGGGGAGGAGGIVFIFARNLVGQSSAKIYARGGAGGAGGSGGAANTGASGTGGASAAGAGGGGGASQATTRIDVIDPHLVQMMRDVMSTSETAPRLAPSAGSGGGGGGCSGIGTSGGSSAGGAGTAGIASTVPTINGNDGKAGGLGGGFASAGISAGTAGCGGGGGGGGNGGVVVICTTTAQADDGHSLSVAGGSGGSGGGAGNVSDDSSGGSSGTTGASGKLVYIQV